MTLVLLPNLLSETRDVTPWLPSNIAATVQGLDGLIAESESGARRYLSLFDASKKIVTIYSVNTPDADIDFVMEPLKKGERWGLISDGGLPCIADPGYKLVALARKRGYHVEVHPGPSSIFMALMLSGLPGQNFHFHGYMDRTPEKTLKTLPSGVTHIFIEAPHRSADLLATLLATLPDNTDLSVSWDISMPSQGSMTYKISGWKKLPPPALTKKPAIFIINK